MKRKLIAAAICFMLALVITIYLSEVVFQVVGRTFDGFSGISFFVSLRGNLFAESRKSSDGIAGRFFRRGNSIQQPLLSEYTRFFFP